MTHTAESLSKVSLRMARIHAKANIHDNTREVRQAREDLESALEELDGCLAGTDVVYAALADLYNAIETELEQERNQL